MAIGRRCPQGCETWPDNEKYTTCPKCGEPTTRYSQVHPLTEDEAIQASFEAFYADWDATHDPRRLDPFDVDPGPITAPGRPAISRSD